MSTQATNLVIRRSMTVERSPDEAFHLFTEGIATWWPLETHSIGKDGVPPETVVLEGREGGRLYERMADGAESSWGEILAWEPSSRVVISWHVNPEWPAATEIEVRFSPEGDGTRVDFEHRGWERLGEQAEEARAGYTKGWESVLGRYLERAASPG